MVYKENLTEIACYVNERNMERLNAILAQIQQSQNIAYLAHVGYQAGSPIFQLTTKDNRHILMMPGFYEVYEHNGFESDVTYELDADRNLVVKYEDEIYPYGTVEEIGSGGTLNKSIARLLVQEDKLRDKDFIYKAS